MLLPVHGLRLTLVLGSTLWLPFELVAQSDVPVAAPPVPPLHGPGWEHTEVAVGGVLHRLRSGELFGRRQAVTVLELDPHAVRLRVAATDPWSRRPTTQLVRDHGSAVAAINGGFFDTSNGTPSGVILQGGDLRHPATGRDGEGAVVVDAEGRAQLAVDLAPTALEHWHEGLSAWPVLLRDGALGRDGGFDPAGPRHPRSMIGWTAEGRRILLCAVDGRHDEAAGMTFHEQVLLLRGLGCVDALNLDGGGSTTLWTATGGGIANHPSDNRRFDSGGERAVANALVVLGRAVFVHDEERAEVSSGVAETCARDDAVGGDALQVRATSSEPAEVVFRLPVPRRTAATASWSLEIHLPGRSDDGDPQDLEVVLDEVVRAARPGADARWLEIGTRAPADEPAELRIRGREPGVMLLIDAVRTVEHERTDR